MSDDLSSGKGHRDENFPVASRLLPRRYRSHLLAIYGFARLADTIGDESEGSRLAELDWLEAELERAAAGTATNPLLRRLTPTIDAFGMDLAPFRALISANRIDQRRRRYATFEELAGYCELSAVPVGRLVLATFGASTPARVALSDRVCTALQVVEHLQDVGEDARQGRVYLPADDLREFGVTDADLLAPKASPALRRLVAFEATRARGLLASGRPLVADLRGWCRVAVAGYVAGGAAAVDAISRADHDVLGHRCSPRRRDVLTQSLQLVFGRPRGPLGSAVGA
ncbi:MAG TPA: squalene synthase HpnC [Acidimicrobiia bacterium]|nr:squalene synthase HpnC [Acidimicrobiia bacterium]